MPTLQQPFVLTALAVTSLMTIAQSLAGSSLHPASISAERALIVAVAAFIGGVINAIAGGGTLFTFPALVAAGIPPLTANATSTVALLPGALSSMHGYRGELRGMSNWTKQLTIPSLLGGAAGAFLLLHTTNAAFQRIVPWLVLGATALFIAQRPVMRWASRRDDSGTTEGALAARGPSATLLAWQFLIGIYGGYFGAGVGILMLAALGFMGFTNIHRMNGLKNWGGFCMNLVAAATFALSGIVIWPVALAMAVSATSGGFVGSRLAQRVKQDYVRAFVGVVGVVSGIWLLTTG